MSTEAYDNSGQVCTETCDSAIEMTPVTPIGIKFVKGRPYNFCTRLFSSIC